MSPEQAIVPVGGELTTEHVRLMEEASHSSDATAKEQMIPWLVIVQASGDYMKRNTASYIEAAREGDLVDTLTLQLRSVAAFIVAKYETQYTTWKPNNGPLVKQWFTDPSGYMAAHYQVIDGKEQTFGTKIDDEGNEVRPSAVFYGLLINETDGTSLPMIVGLSSTQYQKSTRWNTLINMERIGTNGLPYLPPAFSRVYHLSTVPQQGKSARAAGKTWSGWKIDVGPDTLTHPKFGAMWFAKAKALRKAVEDGLVRPMPQSTSQAPVDDDGGTAREPRGTPGTQNDDNIPF
jgi:hypothetical protein